MTALIDALKAAQRRKLREKLRSLSKAQRHAASAAACEHILASFLYAKAHTIFGYLAFGLELNIDSVLSQALSDGKLVYVPRICGPHRIEAVALSSLDAVVTGAYGIRTVAAKAAVAPPDALDLILVPALGYTLSGARLGRGGGYYDAYLAQCAEAIRLGVGYSYQIEESLPTGELDYPVTHLVTEQGLVPCSTNYNH